MHCTGNVSITQCISSGWNRCTPKWMRYINFYIFYLDSAVPLLKTDDSCSWWPVNIDFVLWPASPETETTEGVRRMHNAQCMSFFFFFFLHVQASVLQMLLLFMWQRKMWRRPRGEEIRRRGTYVGVLLTNDFCIVWTWWPVAQYLLYSKVQYIRYAFTVMYMQTSKHNLVFGPDSLWLCAFWEDGEYTLMYILMSWAQ